MNWFRRPNPDQPEGVEAVDRIIERVDHIAQAVDELRTLVQVLQRQGPDDA